jgi:hypothetical protein
MWAFAVLLTLGLVAILYGVSLLIKGEKESIIRGVVVFASLGLLNIVLEWGVRVEIITLISLAILGSYKFFQTEN